MTVNKLAYHERYVEGWNDRDPQKVVDQFVEGGTYYDPSLKDSLIGEEIGEYVTDVAEGFPDFHIEERRVTGTEEVVVHEWTMHGTHLGTLNGIPPTEESIALEGVDVVDVDDNGITSVRGYFDQKEFAEQLGLGFPTVVRQIPKLAVSAVTERL